MLRDQLKVMIVDENADNRQQLTTIFTRDYHVMCLSDVKQCVDTASLVYPDVILLDVDIPHVDAYLVCQELKGNVGTALIPVVLISSMASAQERLKGFEVGAQAYVIKPFEAIEILTVVNNIVGYRSHSAALDVHNKEAVSAAFQAMSERAGLAQILCFLRQTYTYQTLEELAQALLSVTASFGLSCCVKMCAHYGDTFYGCEKGSMESRILDRAHSGEHSLDFGIRTVISERHISLLIKNMPLAQPLDYERIKNHLTVLVSGAQARAQTLEVSAEVGDEYPHGIQAVCIKSHELLCALNHRLNQQKQETLSVINSLAHGAENIRCHLGLTKAQEMAVLSLVDQAVDDLKLLTNDHVRVDESFANCINDLDRLIAGK